MACSLRIISYNVQSFRANKTTVKTLIDKCDIFLLQETLLSNSKVNDLDDILQNNELSCHTLANLSTSLLGGRLFEGLAIIWKTKDNIRCFSVSLTERIISLVLKTTSLKYALLNVHLPYEQSTAQCLQDHSVYKTTSLA